LKHHIIVCDFEQIEGVIVIKRQSLKKNSSQICPTAAMDGMSDWPGEPCDTSIPNIIVGTFETKGMFRDCSIANKEFKPPSYPDEKNFGMLEKSCICCE
jgi:hypothetical protein